MLAAALAHAPAAEACSCAGVSPEVVPGPNVAAPLNTHVWIFNAPDNNATISLRTAGREVPTKVTLYTVPDHGEGFQPTLTARTVELTPQQPLAPRTRYDVVSSEPPFDSAKSRIAEDRTLATITTGTAHDQSPPTWPGPRELEVKETHREASACKIGLPYAQIWLDEVRDEQTPPEQILFAAYAHIPNTAYPVVVSMHRLRSMKRGDLVVLQGGTLCDPSDFVFPEALRKAELVLRPVDLAGNSGKEHQLELVGPLRAWERELLDRVGPGRDIPSSAAVTPVSRGATDSLPGLYIGLGVGALALVVTLVLLREQ